MSDEPTSPFDDMGENQIPGYVVDQGGDEPALRGYALGTDLARHYSFTETIYLAVMARFPEPDELRLFEIALIGATNVGIADAAVHGARLARHLADGAGTPLSVVPTAAIGTAEMTRTQVTELAPLYTWLHHRPDADLPDVARAAEGDRFADALHQAAGSDVLSDFFVRGPSGFAAVLALLYAAGVSDAIRAATVINMARLPIAVAEAFAVTDPAVWNYPLNVPFWDYQPAQGDGDEE